MDKNNKSTKNLSYESDGKMEKNNKNTKVHNKEQPEFFNTTQNSE